MRFYLSFVFCSALAHPQLYFRFQKSVQLLSVLIRSFLSALWGFDRSSIRGTLFISLQIRTWNFNSSLCFTRSSSCPGGPFPHQITPNYSPVAKFIKRFIWLRDKLREGTFRGRQTRGQCDLKSTFCLIFQWSKEMYSKFLNFVWSSLS